MSSLARFIYPLALFAAMALLFNHLETSAYDDGFRQAKSEGDLALEKLERRHQAEALERALAAEASAKEAAKKLQAEHQRNNDLAANLAEQQRKHRTTTDRLTGEIARVNDLYRKALDGEPEPLPACVLTAGWVRVYDEATGATTPGLPTAHVSGRAAAQGAEARAADQLDSGIGPRDLLTHHVRYAEQCKSTAAQLDALIDAVQGNR